jgi:hypothetical protein
MLPVSIAQIRVVPVLGCAVVGFTGRGFGLGAFLLVWTIVAGTMDISYAPF